MAIVLCLGVVVVVWSMMVSDKDYTFGGVIGSFAFGLLGVFFIYGLTTEIKSEPNVTVKATITDFNTVNEQGYHIVGQDGKIYILEKVRK